MNLLAEYGFFLARVVTVIVAIVVILLVIVGLKARSKKQAQSGITVTDLGKEYQQLKQQLTLETLQGAAKKNWLKQQKAEEKQKKASDNGSTEAKPTLWVLSFKGNMHAEQVTALRKEISAVLHVAQPQDEVLLQLESPGGVVHGYGLAASQLQRIKNQGLRLTVAVDKVAASGGYMMACVADNIIAAPFAILGSIGVVAQLPNFNRLLKRNDIDVELHTAGEYKRTLTVFGENSQQGREKFQQSLDETHQLFKEFVQTMRPCLDIEAIATGEYWYGKQALEKKLVDKIATSDEFIIDNIKQRQLISVRFSQPRSVIDRFTKSATEALSRKLTLLWQHSQRPTL